jgi:hypothetical protein
MDSLIPSKTNVSSPKHVVHDNVLVFEHCCRSSEPCLFPRHDILVSGSLFSNAQFYEVRKLILFRDFNDGSFFHRSLFPCCGIKLCKPSLFLNTLWFTYRLFHLFAHNTQQRIHIYTYPGIDESCCYDHTKQKLLSF